MHMRMQMPAHMRMQMPAFTCTCACMSKEEVQGVRTRKGEHRRDSHMYSHVLSACESTCRRPHVLSYTEERVHESTCGACDSTCGRANACSMKRERERQSKRGRAGRRECVRVSGDVRMPVK